jgi:hypothetical protein
VEVEMSIHDLLQAAQCVVDAKGNKTAVGFDYSRWEALLTLWEDLEDPQELHHLREAGVEAVPWDQAKAE